MKERSGGLSLTILGLILAAMSIVAPILWDRWNSRCELTLTQNQITDLVERKADVKGLQIYYFGNVVTSLSKATFTLENTGHTPITKSDVVVPPQLLIEKASVLSAALDRMRPPNLGARISSAGNAVQVSFDLLNPGDSVTFSVLVDSSSPEFLASARIKNIPELHYVTAQKQLVFKKSWPWSVYIVGPFGILLFFAGIGILFEVPREKAQLRLIRSNESPLRSGWGDEEFKRYVKSELKFLTGSRKVVVESLAEQGVADLTRGELDKVADSLCEQISGEPSLGAGLFCLALGAFGIWYVVSNILV